MKPADPGWRTLNSPCAVARDVERRATPETQMTLLKKLFGSKKPVERVRVCVECGMPIAEHREWCSILRARQRAGQVPVPEPTAK
jgi:hypothetical protein